MKTCKAYVSFTAIIADGVCVARFKVIDETSVITEKYLGGVEAVEAAARRVSEEEKNGVNEGQCVPQSKSDLHQ